MPMRGVIERAGYRLAGRQADDLIRDEADRAVQRAPGPAGVGLDGTGLDNRTARAVVAGPRMPTPLDLRRSEQDAAGVRGEAGAMVDAVELEVAAHMLVTFRV
jgi:hypothetical protein